MMKSGRTRDVSMLIAGVLVLGGCGGGSHFKNHKRPPTPVQLTGVVRDSQVTVSPSRIGGGPVILVVANETDRPHVVMLEGADSKDMVGPINPHDTAKLQQTLKPGSYTITAGSPQASSRQIAPGKLTVGPYRSSSSNELLLP
jgi:hypothetical protein